MRGERVLTTNRTKSLQSKNAENQQKKTPVQRVVQSTGVHAYMIRLQRQYGNRFVQRVVKSRQGEGKPSVEPQIEQIYTSKEIASMLESLIERYETLSKDGIQTGINYSLAQKETESPKPESFIFALITAPIVNIGPNLWQAFSNAAVVIIGELVQGAEGRNLSGMNRKEQIAQYAELVNAGITRMTSKALGKSEETVKQILGSRKELSGTRNQIRLELAKAIFKPGTYDEDGNLTEKVVSYTKDKILTTFKLTEVYGEMQLNLTGRSKTVYLPKIGNSAIRNFYRSSMYGDFEFVEVDIPAQSKLARGNNSWLERNNLKFPAGKYWIINDPRIWNVEAWWERGEHNISRFGAFYLYNQDLVLNYEPKGQPIGQKGVVE